MLTAIRVAALLASKATPGTEAFAKSTDSSTWPAETKCVPPVHDRLGGAPEGFRGSFSAMKPNSGIMYLIGRREPAHEGHTGSNCSNDSSKSWQWSHLANHPETKSRSGSRYTPAERHSRPPATISAPGAYS